MISFVLGVEDLADTRFAMSPVHETVLSLRVLRDPGLSALHLPWRRWAVDRLDAVDTRLLMSVVSPRRTLPDFLTPRPTEFAPSFEEELTRVAQVPADRVRRDLLATYAPDPVPPVLRDAVHGDDAAVAALHDALCAALRHYWEAAVEPHWRQMRLLLEADMTYRARQLALGGARSLFADMHPHLRWSEGALHVDKLLGPHHVTAPGRGLLLLPSVFAHKPTPPLDPHEDAPYLLYPCRGVATLWTIPPPADASALTALLGAPRARLLTLLDTPLATVELARRLRITPSAVSQHLQILHATGLLTRTRAGRQVLYRRTPLGDHLTGLPAR
jgi:hypothetical protein